MNNYIVSPKLFRTGFISHDSSHLRIKQGLKPQNITNICMYNSSQGILNRELCRSVLYSDKQAQLNYELPKISNNCFCLNYNQTG